VKSRLADSILFSGIDRDGLDAIEKVGRLFMAGAGGFVFFQDDPADRFFVVLSGKVKVAKISPDGKEQILLLPGPGDSFGEAALFTGKTYPATAEVIENAELVSFSRDAFMSLVADRPELAINMIARLSVLLHHLTRLIQKLSLEDVSTRLAGYILGLLPDESFSGEAKVILTEKKMILASILGTIPETLSRAFARLSKLAVISVDGQEITIHDRDKLAEIAAGEKTDTT
jgi:CRP-like cAMP-binding protein